jgi:two-component system, NtrC family, response regulator HydG
LRDRLEDLPLLAQAFVSEFAKELNKTVLGVSDEALTEMSRHRWPGNVRELRNVMERATIVARGQFVTPADLVGFGSSLSSPPSQSALSSPAAPVSAAAPTSLTPQSSSSAPSQLVPGMTVDEAERQLIAITLAHTGGNKTKAASLLGISLKTLHNKLARDAADRTPDQ